MFNIWSISENIHAFFISSTQSYLPFPLHTRKAASLLPPIDYIFKSSSYLFFTVFHPFTAQNLVFYISYNFFLLSKIKSKTIFQPFTALLKQQIKLKLRFNSISPKGELGELLLFCRPDRFKKLLASLRAATPSAATRW